MWAIRRTNKKAAERLAVPTEGPWGPLRCAAALFCVDPEVLLCYNIVQGEPVPQVVQKARQICGTGQDFEKVSVKIMVKIVTDSSCDISLQRCMELGVEMLPITVNFGEESYRANLDISNQEFYEKLAAAQELPHTAQITPAQFEKIFQPYKESGDEVVCLFISSQMSGTLQSARVAKNILGADNIFLPDTLHVTFALGLLVEEAVKMRDAGLSGAEIVAKIEELVPRVRLFAMIEDLKYLKMGGRLSSTSALVASILGICPIITLKDGLVEVVGKARGKKAAFAAIRKHVEKEPISGDYCVTMGHANAVENCQAFQAYVADLLKKREVHVQDIGSIVGTHAGPGAMGIAYIKK